MVYRNKEGYADPTAGAAIHEAEPKAKKKEYNPEVTNLVSVLKQMIDIAGYEMVGRIVLRDKERSIDSGLRNYHRGKGRNGIDSEARLHQIHRE